MWLKFLLNPLTVYALAAAALSMSLVLFVSVKREMAKCCDLADEWRATLESGQLVVRSMQSEIESLQQSVLQLEEAPPIRPASAGLNLTKRKQVVRMYRRGESVPTIAAALETPPNEIALLLKVHALTNEEAS